MITSAPMIQIDPPAMSYRSGRTPSTTRNQTRDDAMWIPPYAAYARPAHAASTRVRAYAEAHRRHHAENELA
jgi:hypothetical protein